MPIIHTSLSREELRQRIRAIPLIMAGRVPDPDGIAHGFKMRLATAFFEKVKTAFSVKSRGGTDEAGISWPKLSKAYLAYGRRFGRGEKAALKRGAGLGVGNQFSPGGKDGLLSKDQENRWWQVYRKNLAWLAAREPLGAAKGNAAAIAWATIKREGAKTKLEVYGNRQVEILHDTGVLFNSLQPGFVTASGASASYTPGSPDQIVRDEPGVLVVGTNVPYAKYHQGDGTKPGRRQIWPSGDDQLPQAWLGYFAEHARDGMKAAIELIVKG